MTSGSLRERTRRAVRAELADAAQQLFEEQGFAATTVETIAARAGMSRRSFFRYFSSKEDLIAQKYATWSTGMTDALSARPDDEAPWTALRRTFDRITDDYADPVSREHAIVLQGIVESERTLHAAVLAVFHDLQVGLAGVLVDRTARHGPPLDLVQATALTTSAWAAVQSALARCAQDGWDELPAQLDAAMAYLRPAGL